MLVGAIILVVILVIISILVLCWPYIKRLRSKKDFFKRASHSVYELALDKDYYLINAVQLDIDTQVIHFDHIIFGEKYIYCIGDNYRNGSISGKFSDNQWFLYEANGNKKHITNPLLLHNTRIEYLKSAIKNDDILIGICVVNDDCLIDKVPDAPSNLAILNQKDLKDFILKKEKSDIQPIDSIQLDSFVHLIYRMSKESKSHNKAN